MHDTTAAAKSPKKFNIFHDWHVWESPRLNKRRSPAENSMIAASHPEQKTRIMGKPVRQSIYRRCGWKADPKETTTDLRIAHYAVNLVQRFQRHFGIRMQKPEYIAACGRSSDVHLFRTAALVASKKLIA